MPVTTLRRHSIRLRIQQANPNPISPEETNTIRTRPTRIRMETNFVSVQNIACVKRNWWIKRPKHFRLALDILVRKRLGF